jgi:exodeoxyribonuclease VII large subunit
VARLKSEGIFDNNRKLAFPLVPQRIAVISASDSRGFEDFSNKLRFNPYGYVYRLKLFPSLLQGDQAPVQMVARLIEIFDHRDDFDLVVIVRGGGGAIDLNCFNDYRLSRAVARFPLPVITGIGHTTNISIVDEVAHADRITPTDAADFIVEKTHLFEERIYATGLRIRDACMEISVYEEGRLVEAALALKAFAVRITDSEHTRQRQLFQAFSHQVSRRLDHAQLSLFLKVRDVEKKSREVLGGGSGALAAAFARLRSAPGNVISREMMRVDHFGNVVAMLDPAHVLRRGYSITRLNGRALHRAGAVKPGDKIQTQLYEGTIESEVRDAG